MQHRRAPTACIIAGIVLVCVASGLLPLLGTVEQKQDELKMNSEQACASVTVGAQHTANKKMTGMWYTVGGAATGVTSLVWLYGGGLVAEWINHASERLFMPAGQIGYMKVRNLTSGEKRWVEFVKQNRVVFEKIAKVEAKRRKK